MQPLVLAEPWDWLIGRTLPIEPSLILDGSGSPRLLTGSPEVDFDRPAAVLPGGKAALPPSSFPFLLGAESAQAWQLPTDASTHRRSPDFSVALSLGCESPVLLQQG